MAWLALVPAADSSPLKLDPSEVATLGEAHAREHARDRVAIQAAQKRAARMTPSQRRAGLRAAKRSAQRVNRVLADKPRDDIGFWEPTLYPLPEYAINTILMPNGKILYFGRPPIPESGIRPNFGDAEVFDPKTHESHAVTPPEVAESNGLPANIFCAGQALLSDGRVLVVGGQLRDIDATHPNYSGLQYTFLFNPWTEQWTVGPKMSAGRWYPSAAKLPSGDVIIMSGLDENGQGGIAPQMDLFRPGIDEGAASLPSYPGGFRGPNPNLPPGSQAGHGQSLYPRLFTIPDGNVLLAGPNHEDSATLNTAIATTPDSPPLGSAWTQFSTEPSIDHTGGPAVLEPDMGNFGGSSTVLQMGGVRDEPGLQPATNVVERINADPPTGTPGWQPPDPNEALNKARYYDSDVLLPDGGMVVVGGGSGSDPTTFIGNYYLDPNDPTLDELRQVELRRPGEKTWRLGAAQQEWRTYHGTAALLPDGRIFSGGDDYHEGPDPFHPIADAPPGTPVDSTHRRDSAEFYWPPYLFNGDTCAPRPAIRGVGAAAPPADPNGSWATLGYNDVFGVFSEHARSGMQAALVAPAAETHAFDMNQRVIPLQVTSLVTGGGLNVRAPANAAIAQPGWYMLFLVDADGTPSMARWVQLLPTGLPQSTVTGTWPNPKGRTCVNPDGTTVSEPDPGTPSPPPPPPPPVPPLPLPTTIFTAKLGVNKATIERAARKLDVLAAITGRASGDVRIELLAGGKRTTFSSKIDSAKGRIRISKKIPTSEAKLGTGIVTITYGGDADTRPQSVRLRAAAHAAKLKMNRPTVSSGGHVKAQGTISKRARGVVRVQLQFEFAGSTQTIELKAPVSKGAWKLSRQLTPAQQAEIAGRTGTLHSYTLFTGDKRAGIRGEMRSFEVLGNR